MLKAMIWALLLCIIAFLHSCSGNQLAKHDTISHPLSKEKIDVWVPSFKNVAWTVFNIKNMVDLAQSPKSLNIRVLCMTPGENKCSKLRELIDISFPLLSITVFDLSQECNR
jgi:hypothetical protein